MEHPILFMQVDTPPIQVGGPSGTIWINVANILMFKELANKKEIQVTMVGGLPLTIQSALDDFMKKIHEANHAYWAE